jgi:hypothetical protein
MEDSQFQSSAQRAKEDIPLANLLGAGIGQACHLFLDGAAVDDPGFDFDVPSHGLKSYTFAAVSSGPS